MNVSFLLADGEVSAVEDFRNDVNAVLELEVDEVRFAVFHFVKSRLFLRGALDVGECVVVVNRGNQKRLSRSFVSMSIVEMEFRLDIRIGICSICSVACDCAARIWSSVCARIVSSSFLYASASPART